MRITTSSRRARRLAVGALLVLAAGCQQPPSGSVEGASGVRIVEGYQRLPTVLFSDVRRDRGATAKTSFTVENTAGQARRITFAGTSCFCIGAQRRGKELTAGQTFDLPPGGREVLVLTARMPPRPELHHFRAELTVERAGDEAERLDMSFGVPVVLDLKLTPEAILQQFAARDTAVVERNVLVEYAVRSKSMRHEAAVIERLPAHVKLVRLEEQGPAHQIEPGLWKRAWRAALRIQPDPALQGGVEPADARVRIESSGRTVAEARLPVILRRSSGLDAPRSVHFGVVQPGEERVRKMLVSAADQRSFEVRAVRSSTKLVDARSRGIDGRRYWLELVYHAAAVGPLHSEVVVETTHPDCPLLKVEVFGTCAAPDLNKRSGT